MRYQRVSRFECPAGHVLSMIRDRVSGQPRFRCTVCLPPAASSGVVFHGKKYGQAAPRKRKRGWF